MERAVLDRPLDQEFDGVDRLRAQVADLRVRGRCGCGCPSVHFQNETSGGMEVVAEGWTRSRDCSVLLFIDGESRLDALELMWMTEAPPAAWPEPSSLHVQPS
jgi:hypothetical protein